MRKLGRCLVLISSLFAIAVKAYPAAVSNSSKTSNSNTQKTAQYLQSIQNDPLKVYLFLKAMPKGADLHNHLSGATYVEDLIRYAQNDQFCVDPNSYSLTENNNCAANLKLSNAVNDSDFYRNIVERWSMRDYKEGEENEQSNEAHFFPVFGNYGAIVSKHVGEVLAGVVARAGAQHELAIEIMLTPFDLGLVGQQGELTAVLAKDIGWNNNFADMRSKLLANGLEQIVDRIPLRINDAEKTMREQLHCGTAQADPGCNVTVRYQYLALREQPPAQVFANLLTGFLAATKDPRIVAINLVQAEDGPIAVRDYDLHMKMVNYLHQQYPNVHISLHAGELAPQSVTPETLRNHIRDAVEIGKAERIGHGVDIAYEDNAQQLMQEMAQKHVLVEVNLTSNATLLNAKNSQHPLLLYLQNHVPVAISTDDEGVLRTDLTREYQRAITTYNLDYQTVKRLVRNSLTYAFLKGDSLWKDADNFVPIAACAADELGGSKLSPSCQAFLAKNEKARLQWQLEQQFNEFERKDFY